MTKPTQQQVFGANFAQTATTFTITKADLPDLTAVANNQAEQLFVALLLKAKSFLTTANQNNNPEQVITIDDGFESLVPRNNQQYRQNSLTVNLQKLDTGSTIDPDDY